MSFDGLEGRRERKLRHTRERIYRAALELFKSQGFASTKVRDIADRADVSTVTVHNHFRTKDLLLHAIAEDYLDALLMFLEEMTQQARKGPLHAADVIELAEHAFAEAPDIDRQLAADAQRAIVGTATGERFSQETRSSFLALTVALQGSGALRSDLKAAVVAGVVTSLIMGEFTNWLNDLTETQPAAERASEMLAFLAQTLWQGVPSEDRTTHRRSTMLTSRP